MVVISSVWANFNGSGPLGFTGKNATGAGATDGTEFIAATIDNFEWGWMQELFTREGFSPDGVTEAVGASQIVEALDNKVPAGIGIEWNLNVDPATYGARYLLLNGQGILRANYPELDANTYVGDGNNAAVAAAGGGFYRADDAAGTTPNIVGVYLILPESRGVVSRGLDAAATIDPDGASRFLGDLQIDAFQDHWMKVGRANGTDDNSLTDTEINASGSAGATEGVTSAANRADTFALIAANAYAGGSGGGTTRTSTETRMYNRSTQFAIKY